MRAVMISIMVLFPSLFAVHAQDFPVEENILHAQGLTNRRMHDLAEDVLDRVLDRPGIALADRARVILEKANLYKDEFFRGFSLEARIKASEKADSTYRKYMVDFADHPRILNAKMDYGELLLGLGRYRLRLREEALLVGESEKEVQTHQEKALEKLQRAADIFDELRVVIPVSGREKQEEYKETLALAKYYRAILYYFLGQAQGDEASRMATLLEGINYLEEYIFSNENNLRGYWGYLYLALCHREFREERHREDALSCFKGIIHAFKNTIKNNTLGWQDWEEVLVDPGARDLLESTYFRYAETLNDFSRYSDAADKIEELENIYQKAGTEFEFGNSGYLALLQKARSYRLVGNLNASIEVGSDVADRAGAGNKFIQFHCDRFLSTVIDEVEDKSELNSRILFKAGLGAYGQDRFYDALRYFQSVLRTRNVSGEKAQKSWDFISRCYQKLGFRREAAQAAVHGAFRLRSVDETKALDLARRARGLLGRIYRSSGSKADLDRLQQHRKQMDMQFGTESGFRYDTGIQKMQEGEYAAAIGEFRSVKPDAETYELARTYIPFCRINEAKKAHEKTLRKRRLSRSEKKAAETRLKDGYRKAIQEVEGYLKYARANRIHGDPVRRANRDQAIGLAALIKSLALKGLEKWNEGLAVLKHFRSSGLDNDDLLEKVAILRTQLYLGKGDLDRAEKSLAELEKSFPEARKNIVNLKGILGAELANQAERLREAGKIRPALEVLQRSVAYRIGWVKSSEPKINNLLGLAQDIYTLHRFDEARLYLETILDNWGNVRRPRRSLGRYLRLTKLYLARCQVWLGKYVEAESLLRELYERRKRDKNLLEEYASLLTGTVCQIDGRLTYIPGLGGHRKYALKGYKLWNKIARMVEGGTSAEDLKDYLLARFHQNLVRWAQGKRDLAQKSIRQLRVGLGQNLDRKRGSHKEGFWEKRFDWLERHMRIQRRPPQTPPPAPDPMEMEVSSTR